MSGLMLLLCSYRTWYGWWVAWLEDADGLVTPPRYARTKREARLKALGDW